MNKELYNQYHKYMFMIANDDIFDGVKAHSDCKEWITTNNISKEQVEEFNKQMETDCAEGNSGIELETLDDIEYITLKVMTGNISPTWIKSYMLQKNLDSITLQNGLIIKKLIQADDCYYLVEFDSEENGRDSIGLDLFLTISKQKEAGTLPKWLSGKEKEGGKQ